MVYNKLMLDMDKIYAIMRERGYSQGTPDVSDGNTTIPLQRIGSDKPTALLIFTRSERYLVRAPDGSESDYDSLCRDFRAAVRGAGGETSTDPNLDKLAEMFDRRNPLSPLEGSFIGK